MCDIELSKPKLPAGETKPPYPWYVFLILATEACERFTYYSLSGSLVQFLRKHLHFEANMATQISALFSTVSYVSPVAGAYIADKYWGRYKTILFFCAFYICGALLTAVGGFPTQGQPSFSTGLASALGLTGLFLGVAVGAGGIKSNVVVLGADQFELPSQKQEQDSFFNLFYWVINLGAAVSFLVITNIAENGMGIVPERWGFFLAYSIPTVVFAIALAVFFAGRSRYTINPPAGSAVDELLATFGAASKRNLFGFGGVFLCSMIGLLLSFVILVVDTFVGDGTVAYNVMAYTGLATMILSFGGASLAGSKPEWICVDAERPAKAEQDATHVLRLLPLTPPIVVFWIVYTQQTTLFQSQGMQMDLHMGSTNLSAATLNVFDSVGVMLFTPLCDMLVYPFFRNRGMPLSMFKKVGIGFVFASLSVVCAGIIEIYRKRSGVAYLPTSEDEQPMNHLSIWWQAPQYLLIAAGEVFTAITTYELFYCTLPPHLRSIGQAINLLTTAFGALGVVGLSAAFANLTPANLNNGQLEVEFFAIGGLMLATLPLWIFVSNRFVVPSFGDDTPA